jgi:hypothetical protein
MPNAITLTLSMDDYNALLAAKAKAEQETVEALKQLEAARFVDGDTRVARMAVFARDCLTLARFAVANCPPEMIKGWPYETLKRVADGLCELPDYTAGDRDMAIDLISFARDCEKYEVSRKSGEPPEARMNIRRDHTPHTP